MPTEEKIKELLAKYIQGTCSDDERDVLENWYELMQRRKDVRGLVSAEDESRLWNRLSATIEEREGKTVLTVRRLFLRPGWRAAAVWLGIILIGSWAVLQWHRRGLVTADDYSEIATGYGQVRKIVLPDSSVVWLNAATHLSIHADFARNRSLKLVGEAFFDVRHDASHPFVVVAGNAKTTVFGTAFNVAAYPGTRQLRVSLQSGKVGVDYLDRSGSTSRQILEPGQLMIYDKLAGSGELEHQQPQDMNVWTAGRLVFYKTPLKEAFSEIEARYGIHIITASGIKDQTITARFDNTALEKVLEHLSFGWDLHFIREKDTLRVE